MSERIIKKIMIFGRPGSGKSVFALEISELLSLPLHHLDKYFFIDNWVKNDYEKFLDLQQEFVDGQEWIIDGNNVSSLEMRYQKADLCLYFNYSKLLCLWRLFCRLFDKDKNIDDRASNCKERVSWKFIKYMWRFDKCVRDSVEELRVKYSSVQFIEINNRKDLQELEFSLEDYLAGKVEEKK
jgi:adenylate kinase family enzyme